MVRVTLVVRFMVLVLVWSQPGASSPWWPGPHKPVITTSTPTPAPTTTPSMPGQCTVVRTVNNTTRYGFLCNMCQTTTYNCPVEVSVPCSSTPTPTPYPTPTWQPTTIAPYSTTGWWSWGGRGKRWVAEWWPQGNSRTTTPSPTTGYYTSSPYTDDWWPGQGGPAGPACKSHVQRTINDVKCQIMCCNGDEVDPNTGSCNQASEVTCMNGGSVMGHTKACVCPKGFRGSRCQHRACSIMCQNGGVCKTNGTGPLSDVTYNEDYCVCPEDTTGFFCETTLCPLCQNNATCHTGFGFATCRCQEGFSGIYCESPDRSGSCPESAGTCQLQHPMFKSSVCTKDAECPGKQKCCPGCGTRLGHCVDPVFDQTTCRYNNRTIAVNSTFYPDPCRVCTCNTSHGSMPHGVVECTFIACPQLVPNCRKAALQPPDKCCPECADTPDSRFCGASYKPPRFLNCPEELVVLDVDKNSDTAKVSLDLKAVDCNGKNLSVELSDKWVKAGKGEENFLLVSATSQRDANGNFSTCIFHVRVRDTQPPKFVTCPVDFVQPDSGPVTWQVPIATDNVGLAVPPTSRLSPGIRLKSGSHVVLYWAEDYQGNVARCTFLVTVGSNSGEVDGTDEYTGGAGGHGRVGDYHKSEGGNSLGIAFGVIGGLLLLLIPAVIYLLCKRRRNSARLDLTAPTLAMAAANGVAYAVSNGMTSGLPRYTLNAGPDDIMIAPPQYPGPRSVDDVRGAVGGQEADVLPAKNPLS